jgi:TetR/AcrR family transcriptional regulator, transcriptional repressor for nem operon
VTKYFVLERSFQNHYICALSPLAMARPLQFDKDQVLNKAMLLFWERGYFNTSMEDIVERLALSRSSIYNSFPDKRFLFIQSLKHYISKNSNALLLTFSQLPPTPASVKKILQEIVSEHATQQTPKGCLVVNSAIEFANHDKEIKQILENHVADVVKTFEAYITRGQKQGNINPAIKANDLAIALFHQITSLRVTSKVLNDKGFFESSINSFIQLLIKS